MNILLEIVEKNRPALDARKRQVPAAELEKRLPELPGRPDFAAAFAGPGMHVIAELKKASPSKGLIRENLDVPSLASALEKAGAAALSVLTEPFYFRGSLDNLRLAAQSCGLPLLRKDFIFDPYQILEAKCAGASAVLLIGAMLDPAAFRDLAGYAHSLGLRVLGEVHCEEELATVRDADLFGVNARDLRTFSTSLEHSAKLIRLAAGAKPVIAESAVKSREDMQMLVAAGASGFLIGETLMRAAEPGEKLREMIR